jgi:hypothetical protein
MNTAIAGPAPFGGRALFFGALALLAVANTWETYTRPITEGISSINRTLRRWDAGIDRFNQYCEAVTLTRFSNFLRKHGIISFEGYNPETDANERVWTFGKWYTYTQTLHSYAGIPRPADHYVVYRYGVSMKFMGLEDLHRRLHELALHPGYSAAKGMTFSVFNRTQNTLCIMPGDLPGNRLEILGLTAEGPRVWKDRTPRKFRIGPNQSTAEDIGEAELIESPDTSPLPDAAPEPQVIEEAVPVEVPIAEPEIVEEKQAA